MGRMLLLLLSMSLIAPNSAEIATLRGSRGAKKPLVPLAAFSREMIADPCRYVLGLLPRRSGKTFTVCFKVGHALRTDQGDCFCLARAQDGAKENLRQVAQHLKAMKMVSAACSEIDGQDTEIVIDPEIAGGFRLQKFFLVMNNGRRCFAMTSHPDALRGFGAAPNGIISLDEHAFHRDSEEMWKGVAPAVMRGGRVIITSTPHYQIGNFFKLCRKCGLTEGHAAEPKQQGIFSTYFRDIIQIREELIETGLVLDLAELKELAGDEEAWLQEFMCRFLSGAELWFSPELIAAARSPSATAEWNPKAEAEWPGEGRLYVGVDVGRYRDLTVFYIVRRALDMNILRGMIVLERTLIPDQVEALKALLRHPHVARCCIDNTGIGVALADGIRKDEVLVSKLGGLTPTAEDPGRREGQVTFTLETKEKMMVLLRNRMDSHLEKIPENLPMLEKALESIKSTPSALGHRRFDAARTDLAKHADAAWAMALAVVAADSPGIAAASVGADVGRGELLAQQRDSRPSFWKEAGDRRLEAGGAEEEDMPPPRGIRGITGPEIFAQ